jgi:hypothetical protein
MNEEKSLQEKDFRSILNSLQQLGESRDKLSSAIDGIIDRIAENREPICEPSNRESSALTGSNPVVIPTLQQRVREIDLVNERLKAISNRLNKLA